MTSNETPRPTHQLPDPALFEVGTILTIRMRGHSRTHGEEYFAPAVVLGQHRDKNPSQDGLLEVLVWDSTAGTHYNPSYAIREIEMRSCEVASPFGVTLEVVPVVVKENIGRVLFSPDAFQHIESDLSMLRRSVQAIERELGVSIASGGPQSNATPSGGA